MSTGLVTACRAAGLEVDLVAVNHWPTAVQTHTVNHPHARHFCAPVERSIRASRCRADGSTCLMAAPECVHFSTARGGRPMNDQSRASAWHLLRWLELLRVEDVLIENVPEFLTWGPLGATGRPMKSQPRRDVQGVRSCRREPELSRRVADPERRRLRRGDDAAPAVRPRAPRPEGDRLAGADARQARRRQSPAARPAVARRARGDRLDDRRGTASSRGSARSPRRRCGGSWKG
jgi:hypothetical protein